MKINYPFFVIIFILISILVIVFLVFPRYQTVTGLQAQIATKREELANQEKYFKELEETLEKLKNYQGEISKIDSALPQENSFPSLSNFISKTAQSSGLVLGNIGSINANPSSKFPELKENSASFSVVGSYSSLRNFLSSLEKSARLIQIEDISFDTSKESGELLPGQEVITEFNFQIKVYSY